MTGRLLTVREEPKPRRKRPVSVARGGYVVRLEPAPEAEQVGEQVAVAALLRLARRSG